MKNLGWVMKKFQVLYDEAKLLHESNIGLKDFINNPLT